MADNATMTGVATYKASGITFTGPRTIDLLGKQLSRPSGRKQTVFAQCLSKTDHILGGCYTTSRGAAAACRVRLVSTPAPWGDLAVAAKFRIPDGRNDAAAPGWVER